MKGKKVLRLITIIFIAIVALIALITKVLSDNNNNLVVDVIKSTATSENNIDSDTNTSITDENLKIIEEIKKKAGQLYFDSKELNYEVTLTNKNQNTDNRVAIVFDTSYSMQSNDNTNAAKAEAASLGEGIVNNVAGVKTTVVSNSGVKLNLGANSAANVKNAINGLTIGESKDCNDGLEAAYTALGSGAASKTIIYFTDSTDNVSDKMKDIVENRDPTLKIISVLVDMTSSSYLNLTDATPVVGDVYVMPNTVEENDIEPSNAKIYKRQYIYDLLNLAANEVVVDNTFSEAVREYFDIKDITAVNNSTLESSTVEIKRDENNKITGYIWRADQIKFGKSAKLNFTITLKTDSVVAAKHVFSDIYTNEKQEISYKKYNTNEAINPSMKGTDSRLGTESTVIKICKGYFLKLKVINESNTDLPVEGVKVKIKGTNEQNEVVCDSSDKVTDKNGYITLSPDEFPSLRSDGKIVYEVSLENAEELVGYEKTNTVLFGVYNNNKDGVEIGYLDFDNMGNDINPYIEEATRTVEVPIKIVSSKLDFEINVKELNNNVVLSDCEFELIQPKLNNKYEMSVLSGKTDSSGILHLSPTVMTKDGTYEYILRQKTAPEGYEITDMALIKIRFENGRIVTPDLDMNDLVTMYNENVSAILKEESKTSDTDHVLVTVQDVCVAENPFNLQINLADADDNSIKLNDTLYSIETLNSNNQSRTIKAVTDENGQVNVEILGSGILTINIKEETPKTGYVHDNVPKKLVIQRVNNQITIIDAQPSEIRNTDAYKINFLKDEEGNPVGLKVDLTSKKKAKQNILKLKLVDSMENDVPIGEGILYDLVDENGKSYGPIASDADGEIAFVLGNEAEGTHRYKLTVVQMTIPAEYDTTKIDGDIDLDVVFDENGYITQNTHKASTAISVLNEGYNVVTNGDSIDYTYELTIKYELKQDSYITFAIQLLDEEDKRTPLDGAKYNVTINYETTVNGLTKTRTKKLTKRATNVAGKINTFIPKSEHINIYVTEYSPKVGYTMDTTPEEIELSCLANGNVTITQSPYDLGVTDTTKPYKGTDISADNKTITYHDYNRKRNSSDTYINLTLSKIDLNDAYVDGVIVNFRDANSDKNLEDGNGNVLDTTIITGSQATIDRQMTGEAVFDYEDWKNNEPNSYTIKVPEVPLNSEATYYMDITELKENLGSYSLKASTAVRLKITFKNRDGNVEMTECVPTYGNRLVKSLEFASGADMPDGVALQDALGIFLGNINIAVYTNYEDVGNLSLDLKKKAQDSEDPLTKEIVEGEYLNGAKYEVKVQNPDARVYYYHPYIDNGSNSDSIELKGLTLNVGSIIYINEEIEPIGFAKNENTETFEVTEINDAGEVTLEHINNSYNPTRAVLKRLASELNSAGNLKANYVLELIDYQLDTFEVEVDTIDSNTLNPVNGFKFLATTSMGAQSKIDSWTPKNIGGNPSSKIVTYTFTAKNDVTYYKPLKDDINVNVVFDASGNVDVNATMNAQTDPNYGTIWTISNLNATAIGNLKIEVKVDHQDPLNVKIRTLDAITNKIIQNASYKITPSVDLLGEGATDFDLGYLANIDVGYILTNGKLTYTLEQKAVQTGYVKTNNFKFSVEYKNEKIKDAKITSSSGTIVDPTVQVTGDREILITVYADPKVPFKFKNIAYFDNTQNLEGAIFEVSEKVTNIPETGVTNIDGETTIYNDVFGKSNSKIYTVKQIKASFGFATVEDFYIRVYFNDNRKITDVKLIDINGTEVTTNRFVKVGYKDNGGNTVDNVTIEVKNYPDFKINITDYSRIDNVTLLPGTVYSVTSSYIDDNNNKINFMSTSGVTTNSDGLGIAHLDRTKFNTVVTYIIKEDISSSGYQPIEEDLRIKVTFDQDGYVQNAVLDPEQIANTPQLANIVTVETITGDEGRFKINVKVKNNPKFLINIKNIDRRDGTTPIAGTIYDVSSKYVDENSNDVAFTSANGVVTQSNGIGIADLNKSKFNTEIIYTIKENTPATGYQTLGKDVQVRVIFDDNSQVQRAELVDNNLSDIVLVEIPLGDIGKTSIKVTIKNNPLLKIRITTEDRLNNNVKLKDVGYQITSAIDTTIYSNSSSTNNANLTGSPETSYSDLNGLSISYMDKTLESKEMIYTITEVKKAIGYNWINDPIKLNIVYDPNGVIDTASISQGSADSYIILIDKNNFTIDLIIYNDEIEEFGIHLITEDTYDSSKKINNMKVEAFLTESGTNSYNSDGYHEFAGNNALITGADRDNDGKPDLSYGEDYKTMGQYIVEGVPGHEEHTGGYARLLRLVIKNDSRLTRDSGYYLDSYDGSKTGNNIGFYKGTTYYNDARYQTVKYQYLISVTFDDEGKITNAQMLTGENHYLGWLVDSNFLEVSHTNYKLNIKMKFFPMLKLDVNSMDNYLKNADGSNIYLSGRYTISTYYPGLGEKANVKAGYIGYGKQKTDGVVATGQTYEDTNSLYVPIEKNYTRDFYIYEEKEPTTYQQHRPKEGPGGYSGFLRLIAIITIKFDEKGEIDYDHSINRHLQDNNGNYTGGIIPIYMDGAGTGYLVNDNLKTYRYEFTKMPAKTTTTVSIGYALTTKINVTAVDDITGTPISNIRMYPFANNTYKTNQSHKYYQYNYRITNNNGSASWEYWGSAEANGMDKYKIGSARVSNYNGYFFPDDMTSTEIGGSGSAIDYFANLDVTYDANGRISEVKSVGHDLWGDENATNISWNSNTGTINIKMLYSRKFQTKLNKIDFYDSTIKLQAKFNVISNKGVNTKISTSNKMLALGKVYKDTTVKYTLSETEVPYGYYPISDTIDYYVTYDNEGNISTTSVKSDNEYFGHISTSDTTQKSNKIAPDLTLNIKNKPAFNLDLRVIDEFYKGTGIGNINLKITNSKGDTALGNPKTDSSGYSNVVASPVYPGETVKYYIEQLNTATGYYPNNTIVELDVEFNNAGKIATYSIKNGNEIINHFNGSAYLNKRAIALEIMNMPKDVKMGIYKYDQITNRPINSVEFTIKKKDLNSGIETEVTTNQLITDTKGNIMLVVDQFERTNNGKTIQYTITEKNVPPSYRKVEDIVFNVGYNKNGSIAWSSGVISNGGIQNQLANVRVASYYEKYNSQKNTWIYGGMEKFDGQNVNMVVTIPNDNAFDLIIKDEDRNYLGLGIEGTKYDVSIDGTTYTPASTNANGITSINNITKTGSLIINIAEKSAGEGYRTDILNKATIKLNKGTNIYTLDLDNTQDGFIDDKNAETKYTDENNNQVTRAIINVDEKHGKVYVTFKNVTKTELTLLKQDYNTLKYLKDAKFEITAQQVHPVSGDNINDPITITTEGNNITNTDGKLYFDLGVAPQSQKWIYTFKELETPMNYNVTPNAPYNQIVDTTVVAVYDQYGRVTLEPTTNSRIRPILANGNKNCRHIMATIYNGDIPPSYTVKVVKKDFETGNVVNGASIYMNITDLESGNLIEVKPRTSSSAVNGQITKTANIGIDGNRYTDEELQNNGVPLIGRGYTYIDNIDYNGDINIEVSEEQAADGYIFGNQKVNGNVKIKAKYIPQVGADTKVEFTILDKDGLEVETNNITKEIIITIYNEPRVIFHINKSVYGESTPIEGVSFNITAKENGMIQMIPLDLDITTGSTNANGQVVSDVGKPCAGKTIIYSLSESPIDGYQDLGTDIEVEVVFDSSGNITSTKLLTAQTMCNVSAKGENANPGEPVILGKDIYLNIKNKKDIPNYKVQVEKHIIDSDVQRTDYSRILEGATYNVLVQQENGKANTTFSGTSGDFGIIDEPDLYFDGTGLITITIQETIAPEGYTLDPEPKVLKLQRDIQTGKFTEVENLTNMSYRIIDTSSSQYSSGQPFKIILEPFDKQNADKFSLKLNKYSTASNLPIENNHAVFSLEMIQEDENGNIVYDDYLGDYETNDYGLINQSNLKLPKDPGEYKLLLTEVEAPRGYILNDESTVIKLTIESDPGGFPIITKSEIIVKNEDGVEVELPEPTVDNPFAVESKYQLISADIGNNIIPGYKVQVEKHTLDTAEDLNAFERPVEGATYKITVYERDAGTNIEPFYGTTDANGLIDIPYLVFNGFGKIFIKIQEISAPDGYLVDDTERFLTVYRDPETGNFEEDDTNVGYKLINTDSLDYNKWDPVIARLIPVDRQERGKYSIVLNKYAHDTNELITETSARFKVRVYQKDENDIISYDEDLGTHDTNKGKVKLSNLSLPINDGTYRLEITETQSPDGYVKLKDPIEVDFKVGINSYGDKIIKNVRTNNSDVELIARDQLIYLNISNKNENELLEDEYSLDITKVDAETGDPIDNMALFKVWLPDALNTAVYTETSQTILGPGKLDYCFVEQDKNYSVRLTHMNQPGNAGTVQYTFREIVPPEGYDKISEDLVLTIDFQYDENGKLYYNNAISSNPDYLRINTPLPSPINKSLSIDILNNKSQDDLYLKSKEYLIGTKPAGWIKSVTETEYKDGDLYMSKVEHKTTLADYLSNLDTNGTPVVTKPDGTVLGLTDYVGTGMKLTVTKGKQKIELLIAVTGDVDGNGQIEITDLAEVRRKVAKVNNNINSDIKILAVDFDDNGKIDLTDLCEERKLQIKVHSY